MPILGLKSCCYAFLTFWFCIICDLIVLSLHACLLFFFFSSLLLLFFLGVLGIVVGAECLVPWEGFYFAVARKWKISIAESDAQNVISSPKQVLFVWLWTTSEEICSFLSLLDCISVFSGCGAAHAIAKLV